MKPVTVLPVSPHEEIEYALKATEVEEDLLP
jgi:hypothetical protein